MLFAFCKLSDSWSSHAAPIRSAIKGSSKDNADYIIKKYHKFHTLSLIPT
jgi:hypothetical protein